MKASPKYRSKWLTVRLTPEEEQALYRLYSRTTCKALSAYARKVLLQDPVVILYRNQSADDFLSEMVELKNELNAIGQNFNQLVKRLHTLDHLPEIKTWVLLNEASKKSFFQKMDQIMEKLSEVHQSWLPK